jgi:hypothetical protein
MLRAISVSDRAIAGMPIVEISQLFFRIRLDLHVSSRQIRRRRSEELTKLHCQTGLRSAFQQSLPQTTQQSLQPVQQQLTTLFGDDTTTQSLECTFRIQTVESGKRHLIIL